MQCKVRVWGKVRAWGKVHKVRYCQTRIGIDVTSAYRSLSYRSDSRVRGDCDRRPVPVCEGSNVEGISEV